MRYSVKLNEAVSKKGGNELLEVFLTVARERQLYPDIVTLLLTPVRFTLLQQSQKSWLTAFGVGDTSGH